MGGGLSWSLIADVSGVAIVFFIVPVIVVVAIFDGCVFTECYIFVVVVPRRIGFGHYFLFVYRGFF